MALNFAGGSDHIYYTQPASGTSFGGAAFWMRTTSVVANALVLSFWGQTTSRNGWGIFINNTAGKIEAQGYAASPLRNDVKSTSNVNDGNPHHIAYNYGRGSGDSCTLYVDGVQEATAVNSGIWTNATSNQVLSLGDNLDTFWGSYVGDLWDVAHWMGPNLTADEIAALAKGFTPPKVKTNGLKHYSPLVRETGNRFSDSFQSDISGTSVVEHGRIIGGMI